MQAENKPTYHRTNYSNKDKGKLNLALLLFVEECLLLFRNKYLGQIDVDERISNQNLYSILESESRFQGYPFLFSTDHLTDNHTNVKKKKAQGIQINVDFGVCLVNRHHDGTPFYSLEAKRLRSPISRSKHYVAGNTGGIERFKKEQHGKGMNESAMIGYLEAENFSFWEQKVNDWITKLSKTADSIWAKEDLLSKEYEREYTIKLKSNHYRKKDSILLQHLWVNMNSPI